MSVGKYVDVKTLVTVLAASYVAAVLFAFVPDISPANVAAKLKS